MIQCYLLEDGKMINIDSYSFYYKLEKKQTFLLRL